MSVEAELIVPRRGKKELPIGSVAAMVAMEKDLPLVRKASGIWDAATRRILNSNVYTGADESQAAVVVGPMVGAPYAVLVLEKLIVLGAKKVVFLGWCGSFQAGIKTGDLVIPTGASIGEGTSPYYGDQKTAVPSASIVDAIVGGCRIMERSYHKGMVWSTDAPYRETKDRVVVLQKDGVLAVDMEVSALFTVARFRGIALGALLVVSDELALLTWKPGFSTEPFQKTRLAAANIVAEACRVLTDGNPQ